MGLARGSGHESNFLKRAVRCSRSVLGGQRHSRRSACLPAAFACGATFFSFALLPAPRRGQCFLGERGAWLQHLNVGSGAEEHAASGSSSRRQLGTGAFLAAGSFLTAWSWLPEDALAFRNDRIYNAKRTQMPKIRTAYQKIEGLRNDIYLDIELPNGTQTKVAARAADWYDGADRTMVGTLQVGPDFGCTQDPAPMSGIALIPRGRCPFGKKMEQATASGAQAVLVYDEKMSKIPYGSTRMEWSNNRAAGDALLGGVAMLPVERGITIMASEVGAAKPKINAMMISRSDGIALAEALSSGGNAKILRLTRPDFSDGLEEFVASKQLSRLIDQMEIYGNVMRISKDDMKDPILGVLKKDRKAFEKAVKSKDYVAIKSTFTAWNGHLDSLGQFELSEID